MSPSTSPREDQPLPFAAASMHLFTFHQREQKSTFKFAQCHFNTICQVEPATETSLALNHNPQRFHSIFPHLKYIFQMHCTKLQKLHVMADRSSHRQFFKKNWIGYILITFLVLISYHMLSKIINKYFPSCIQNQR